MVVHFLRLKFRTPRSTLPFLAVARKSSTSSRILPDICFAPVRVFAKSAHRNGGCQRSWWERDPRIEKKEVCDEVGVAYSPYECYPSMLSLSHMVKRACDACKRRKSKCDGSEVRTYLARNSTVLRLRTTNSHALDVLTQTLVCKRGPCFYLITAC